MGAFAGIMHYFDETYFFSMGYNNSLFDDHYF